jgi:ABC-type transport system involved in cytochrome bd biosynthesis fused ATPase/permease subunit
MQLNSVIMMDRVAFGGAALGDTLAVRGVLSGSLSLAGGLAVTLLCAEFFLPLRLLGSYFHVAMSGVAAAHSIFRLLDIKTEADGARLLPEGRMSVQFRDVTFAYERERPVLNGVGLTLAPGRLVSLAGVSGCGKSTVAALLSGRRRGYAGEISIGGEELRTVARASLQSRVTLVAHDGYVFAGTVAENLRLARPEADDAALGEALRQVRLEDFFASRQGLATPLAERGANLSGGQRQRLCIARALLQNSAVYIFDEATSNIDAESEAAIMAAVRRLARDKTVLLISHRLANLIRSDRIYLLSGGRIAETGSHEELMASRGLYARLYEEQRRLERRGKGAAS